MELEEQWWSAEVFATELGITPRWLKDRCAPSWPAHDRLPHHRVGRELRFSPEDRAAIKARFAQGPRPAPPAVTGLPDLDKALKGMAKLRELQGATP
jgi:hypothetical protein